MFDDPVELCDEEVAVLFNEVTVSVGANAPLQICMAPTLKFTHVAHVDIGGSMRPWDTIIILVSVIVAASVIIVVMEGGRVSQRSPQHVLDLLPRMLCNLLLTRFPVGSVGRAA